jgi:hypothetical protein
VVAGAGVLANDTDADFGPLRASSELPIAPPATGGGAWTFPSDPADGTLALGIDGSFVYTPDEGFVGTDSFTYLAQDARGRSSDPATVTVTVADLPNNVPVANADTVSTVAATPVSIAAPGVLANDTDAENDILTAGSPSDPAHGNVTLGPDGSFTYTPDINYSGPDSFTYVVDDGHGGSALGTVAVTVTPAPGPTAFSVADFSLAEGTSGTTVATFTVARTGNASAPSSVKYKTSGGSATAGTDYTPVHLTTVSFAPNETTKPVNVTITADNLAEKDETLNLVLSAPVAAVIADASGVATIANDDGAALLSVNNLAVTEGNAGTTPVSFTITRTGNTNGTSTVTYRTSGGTAAAGSDYTAVGSTTVIFDPGQSTKTVTTNLAGDTADEANETFNLVLSAPVGATLADASGTAYITDEDGTTTPPPAPTFLSLNDPIVSESSSGTTATFTVTRSGATAGASSVKVKTSGGTATVPGDYTAVALTTVSFAGGETAKTVDVPIAGDNLPEASETFNLVLSAPTGVTIADAAGTATILNDDGAAYVTVANISLTETDTATTPATFTVTRTGNTNGTTTVKVKTSNGTAAAGTDYTSLPLTSITFTPGETTKTITVDVTGDSTFEKSETFNLVLSTPTGATISDAAATATITNDD